MLNATRPQRLRSLYGERQQPKTDQLEMTPGVRNVDSRLQMQLGREMRRLQEKAELDADAL